MLEELLLVRAEGFHEAGTVAAAFEEALPELHIFTVSPATT